jgi:hypothetical protein
MRPSLSTLLASLTVTTLALGLTACSNTIIGGGESDPEPQPGCEGMPEPPSDGWCPPAWSCVDGAWVDTAGACPEPACPMSRPMDGEACDMIGQSCFYEEFVDCGEGGGTVTATCTADGWVTAWPRCSPPLECPETIPEHGFDCTGWENASYCQFDLQKSCGDVLAIVSCEYLEDDMRWNVQLQDDCGGCAAHETAEGCDADPSCRYLVPGCGDVPVPEAGCYPRFDCVEGACAEGESCTAFTADPCWDSVCDACGIQVSLCTTN